MSDPFPSYTPSSRRVHAHQLGSLDLRVEKAFPFSSRGRLSAYIDVFNATNVGRPTDFIPLSGPSFGTVWGWTDPRTARAGVRIEF